MLGMMNYAARVMLPPSTGVMDISIYFFTTIFRSTKNAFPQCIAADFKMRRDFRKYGGQGTDSQWRMIRDSYVVFAAQGCRESHVTAGLARNGIAPTTDRARTSSEPDRSRGNLIPR